MNKDEQLALIRSKCIEANPEINNRQELYHPNGMGMPSAISLFGRIRLADVLLAIPDLDKRTDGISRVERIVFFGWNLRTDDLTQQSDECIKFLADLLK